MDARRSWRSVADAGGLAVTISLFQNARGNERRFLADGKDPTELFTHLSQFGGGLLPCFTDRV